MWCLSRIWLDPDPEILDPAGSGSQPDPDILDPAGSDLNRIHSFWFWIRPDPDPDRIHKIYRISGRIWIRGTPSKGKGLDTWYSATYTSQTRDQQSFTISEVAAD